MFACTHIGRVALQSINEKPIDCATEMPLILIVFVQAIATCASNRTQKPQVKTLKANHLTIQADYHY